MRRSVCTLRLGKGRVAARASESSLSVEKIFGFSTGAEQRIALPVFWFESLNAAEEPFHLADAFLLRRDDRLQDR